MEDSDWDTDTEKFPVTQQQVKEEIQVSNQRINNKFRNSRKNHMSIFFEKEIQILLKEIRRVHSVIGIKSSKQNLFKGKIEKLESDEQTDIELQKIIKFQQAIENLETQKFYLFERVDKLSKEKTKFLKLKAESELNK